MLPGKNPSNSQGIERIRVLTFVRYYLPGFKSGGPVRTIANMVDHLSSDLKFLIVTSDRDALDTKPYNNIAIDEWNAVGNAEVYYASPRNCTLKTFARLICETPHDVLYLNSLFDPLFTVMPLLARTFGLISKSPTVIAPRGEFSEGALALKAWKKRPFLIAAKYLGLYRDLLWQASSEYEVEDIRRNMGWNARLIRIAPNLPPVTTSIEEPQRLSQSINSPFRMIFLSRITPKKNLDFALDVLSRVTVPVEFAIYGPIGDEVYWRKCRQFISKLPEHIRAVYGGSLPPAKVPEVLATFDLFFLPTRGENFGHVILEALCAGTPVLISDQTPWPQDIMGGCTICAVGDIESFVEAIERSARLSPAERRLQCDAALAAAKTFIEGSPLREQNLDLFREAIASSQEFVHHTACTDSDKSTRSDPQGT